MLSDFRCLKKPIMRRWQAHWASSWPLVGCPLVEDYIWLTLAQGVSAVLGWFLILGLLFSMQDYDATVGSTTGQPVTQIFLDTVGEKGAIVLMVDNSSSSFVSVC
jgi:hypothetical protein